MKATSSAFDAALELFEPPAARALAAAARNAGAIREICVYAGRATAFWCAGGMRFCGADGTLGAAPEHPLVLEKEACLDLLARAAEYSLFRKTAEFSAGFLSYRGLRIAVCGAAGEGRIGERGITSVHIRLPAGSAPPLPPFFPALLEAGGVLLAGGPGSGKTTLLKSCIRFLAGGAGGYRRLAVVDERGELGDFVLAEAVTADLLASLPKAEAIGRAVRLLTPEWVVCDELGAAGETRAVCEALCTGACFLATMHAGNFAELQRRRQFRILAGMGVFRSAVLLDAAAPGRVLEVRQV